jgi:hypothetical protein
VRQGVLRLLILILAPMPIDGEGKFTSPGEPTRGEDVNNGTIHRLVLHLKPMPAREEEVWLQAAFGFLADVFA